MESETRREPGPTGDLDDVARARAVIAELLITPWWYLPALGVLLALPAVGFAIGFPQGSLLCVLGLAGSLVLTTLGVRRTGVRYAGSVRGVHDRWLASLAGVLVLAYGAALWIGSSTAHLALAAIPVVAVVAMTVLLGRRYERALGTTLKTLP